MRFLTINLSLPNSVGHPPQCRNDEEDVVIVRVWHPVEEDSDDDDVEASSKDKNWNPSKDLDDGAKSHGEDGIKHAVGDHHVADVVHTPTASDVSLQMQNLKWWILDTWTSFT